MNKRIYYRPDGTPSRWPLDREIARERRSPKYDAGSSGVCPDCAPFQSHTREGCIRYTKNDRCVLCASMDSYDLYYVLHRMSLKVDSELVEVFLADGVINATGRDAYKSRRVPDQGLLMYEAAAVVLFGTAYNMDCNPHPPKSPTEAHKIRAKYYLRPDCCRDCGAVGLREASSGKCYFCAHTTRTISPRQQAISNGVVWYSPSEPCTKCDTLADRRTYDSRCSGCDSHGVADSRLTPDSIMMEACPDLVLSKVDARVMGVRVYRTGEYCRAGHAGYRYVSTGNCIECKKGR